MFTDGSVLQEEQGLPYRSLPDVWPDPTAAGRGGCLTRLRRLTRTRQG